MDDENQGGKPKRTRINQTDVPAYPLVEALRVAEAIAGEFARRPVKPLRLAQALDVKPSSSRFRTLTGAAYAYGLTTAAYNSSEIGLTELGRRCVAPTHDGQDASARKDAFMKPRIISKLMQTYNGTKFPSDRIGVNVLIDMGIAAERAAAVLDLIRTGARTVGLIDEIKGELYVDIDRPAKSAPPEQTQATLLVADAPVVMPLPASERADPTIPATVFVGSGSSRITEQLQELLVFGKFQPVIAGLTDTGVRSVIAEMRSCSAAVLQVGEDTGDAALIQIGAAMALYGDRTILLVGSDIRVPAVLEGLREVRYRGDSLDVEATMALLKAFNEISAV